MFSINCIAQKSVKASKSKVQQTKVVVDIDTVYKVNSVKWLDSGNGLIDKAEVNVSLTVNKAKDVLTTSIPILDGQFHTKFKILHRAEYEFTGIPAMIYGTKVVDMDLINTESLKRIHIMISDKLIIKVD